MNNARYKVVSGLRLHAQAIRELAADPGRSLGVLHGPDADRLDRVAGWLDQVALQVATGVDGWPTLRIQGTDGPPHVTLTSLRVGGGPELMGARMMVDRSPSGHHRCLTLGPGGTGLRCDLIEGHEGPHKTSAVGALGGTVQWGADAGDL